ANINATAAILGANDADNARLLAAVSSNVLDPNVPGQVAAAQALAPIVNAGGVAFDADTLAATMALSHDPANIIPVNAPNIQAAQDVLAANAAAVAAITPVNLNAINRLNPINRNMGVLIIASGGNSDQVTERAAAAIAALGGAAAQAIGASIIAVGGTPNTVTDAKVTAITALGGDDAQKIAAILIIANGGSEAKVTLNNADAVANLPGSPQEKSAAAFIVAQGGTPPTIIPENVRAILGLNGLNKTIGATILAEGGTVAQITGQEGLANLTAISALDRNERLLGSSIIAQGGTIAQLQDPVNIAALRAVPAPQQRYAVRILAFGGDADQISGADGLANVRAVSELMTSDERNAGANIIAQGGDAAQVRDAAKLAAVMNFAGNRAEINAAALIIAHGGSPQTINRDTVIAVSGLNGPDKIIGAAIIATGGDVAKITGANGAANFAAIKGLQERIERRIGVMIISQGGTADQVLKPENIAAIKALGVGQKDIGAAIIAFGGNAIQVTAQNVRAVAVLGTLEDKIAGANIIAQGGTIAQVQNAGNIAAIAALPNALEKAAGAVILVGGGTVAEVQAPAILTAMTRALSEGLIRGDANAATAAFASLVAEPNVPVPVRAINALVAAKGNAAHLTNDNLKAVTALGEDDADAVAVRGKLSTALVNGGAAINDAIVTALTEVDGAKNDGDQVQMGGTLNDRLDAVNALLAAREPGKAVGAGIDFINAPTVKATVAALEGADALGVNARNSLLVAISDHIITPTRQAQVDAALAQLNGPTHQIAPSFPDGAKVFFPAPPRVIAAPLPGAAPLPVAAPPAGAPIWSTTDGLGNHLNTLALQARMAEAKTKAGLVGKMGGAVASFAFTPAFFANKLRTDGTREAHTAYNNEAIAAAQTLSLAALGLVSPPRAGAAIPLATNAAAFAGLNNAQIDAIDLRRDHIINRAVHLRELVEVEEDADQRRELEANADHLDYLIDAVDIAKGRPAHERHIPVRPARP
ncbi:MAG: hypothetical protein B7Y25_04305, partial [Alphaproteobacteria bacterium 16-39-46]